MIIFGTRTLTSTKQHAPFHCPRCSMQREGRVQAAKRWFTLYFIPCIPMGSAGEYVECTACSGTYAIEILNYNPAVEQANLAQDFRRMLCMVLLASGRTQQRNVEALQAACFDVFEANVSAEEIYTDLRLAQEARADLRSYVQATGSGLSADGKKLFLRVAAQILSAAGPLQESDKGVVRQVGEALGVPSPYVESALVPAGLPSPAI